MKEDFKNYKDLNNLNFISFSAYYLLKIIYFKKEFYEEILKNEISLIELDILKDADLIRIVNKVPFLTSKAKKLFSEDDEVKEVINYFNELKQKYLKINHISKCKSESNSIKQRIKDYGIKDVKNVLFLKFNIWLKDPKMKPYLTSMATLIKASNFEGYVSQIELLKNKQSMPYKNEML